MDNTKSPKNVSLKNQLELWLFCALIGAVAGALVWILLKLMAVGTEFLWKWLPGKTSVPYYTILICAAGPAIIRIFRYYRRFMLLGRRQSEVCQTEYQKLFADRCRSLHECAVSCTSVRHFRSRRKL